MDMLEEERNDGVIERRGFLGRSVWDVKGVSLGSVVKRIRAGIDSRREYICCCIWSSEFDFLGLLIIGTVDTSMLPKTGASSGVDGMLSGSGVVGSMDGDSPGVVGRNNEGRLASPGAGELGGLIS